MEKINYIELLPFKKNCPFISRQSNKGKQLCVVSFFYACTKFYQQLTHASCRYTKVSNRIMIILDLQETLYQIVASLYRHALENISYNRFFK